MKNALRLFLLLFAVSTFGQAPTDNPMKTFYADSGSYPVWTDEINWSNVIVMENKNSGVDNFTEFKTKRDQLYAQGGGVLYYPAGTYNFDLPDDPQGEGLLLKTGVVIRGQKPSTDVAAVTSSDIINMTHSDHGLKNLPTKFVFVTESHPKAVTTGQIPRGWNCIGSKPDASEKHLGEVKHVGVAWVEMNFGYIWFGGGASSWAAKWNDGFWIGKNADPAKWGARVPDGTHPMDHFAGTAPTNNTTKTGWEYDTLFSGEKKFVFGCNLKNAAIPDKTYQSNKNANEIAPSSWMFGGKIGVAGKHVFVGNNVIPKPTEVFMVNHTCHTSKGNFQGQVKKTYFNYAFGIGIEVNKSQGNGWFNKCILDDPNGGFYDEDIIVRDNWVYNIGNKGYEITGKWVTIKNNVNYRRFFSRGQLQSAFGELPEVIPHSSGGTGWCWTDAESVDDFQSRAFDIGGWNVWIDNNMYTGTGTSVANDGEGILCQRHTGVEVYSWAMTHNKQGTTGDKGYIAPYDVHCVGLFHGWNYQRGSVGIAAVAENYAADISVVENYDIDKTTKSRSDGIGGTNVKDFYDASCPSAAANAPKNVQVVADQIHHSVTITWDDADTSEIAFKVQKKKVGTNDWITIAYRPRSQTGGTVTFDDDFNPKQNYGAVNNGAHCFDGTTRNVNEQKWVDFTTESTEDWLYRVVAVNCADDASQASDSVLVTSDYVLAPSDAIATLAVKAAPNPTSGDVRISFSLPSGETANVSILDYAGRSVKYAAQNTSGVESFSTDDMPSGVYIIKVFSSNGSTSISKLIVE